MEPQILFKDAYEKEGSIYVPALIAEGEYWNKNGICYSSSLLEKWHNSNEGIGIAHNAHPSGNHPLQYEDSPPDDLAESAQVAYYRKKSHDWGFGSYVKTMLKTLDNGSKRLIGIFKITEDGAKKAWRERKFPRFVSSSAFIHERDDKGVITDASLVGVSSVIEPAYPPHIAGVDKDCTGGDECISKLAESASKRDHYCMYCRHTTLSKISSLSNEKLSESSMENASPNTSENPNAEGTNKQPQGEENKSAIKDLGQTQTSADGSKTETISEGEKEVDYKSLYEAMQKENKTLKSQLKTESETNATNTENINKLVKKSLGSEIRERLAKVPLFAFDNKEENKEEVVKEFLGYHPRLNEKEILSLVESKYKLAPLVVEAHKRSQEKESNLKESGLITNDGKLVIHDENTKEEYSIYDATEVFG